MEAPRAAAGGRASIYRKAHGYNAGRAVVAELVDAQG